MLHVPGNNEKTNIKLHTRFFNWKCQTDRYLNVNNTKELPMGEEHFIVHCINNV